MWPSTRRAGCVLDRDHLQRRMDYSPVQPVITYSPDRAHDSPAPVLEIGQAPQFSSVSLFGFLGTLRPLLSVMARANGITVPPALEC